MAVNIAEYLGQRVDVDFPPIVPSKKGDLCPFMNKACDKLNRTKPNPPICSVRKKNGSLWIVCPHRLCSTSNKIKVGRFYKRISLVDHQKNILWAVAKTIYRGNFNKKEIVVAREVSIPLEGDAGTYHADYVMRNLAQGAKVDEVLLEMQGGGETSQTGAITRKVEEWVKSTNRSNLFLRETVNAGTIETNAWRRQQEQFLVKGNVVSQTGGKLVFAVGTLLYDYLKKRFERANLRDLRNHNWTLCLIAFKEDTNAKKVSGSIPLIVDDERLLFTNYSTFVRFLTDQGGPNPQIFEGLFVSLDGNYFQIEGTNVTNVVDPLE